MILVGVPYSVEELTESGSPYGPSRIAGRLANQEIEQADIKVARALGRRFAEVTKKFVLVTTSSVVPIARQIRTSYWFISNSVTLTLLKEGISKLYTS
jgi:hypothetical protein